MLTLSRFKKCALSSLAVACLSASLSACNTAPIALGASEQDVQAKYGRPSAVVPLAVGKRLQYSSQPAGQTALMVDIDAAGRVTSARQVLNSADFARVVMGQWTKADALREFGRPASIERVGNWSGDILIYRWQYAHDPMLFYVYLDANQVVQQTGTGMEYRREPWK